MQRWLHCPCQEVSMIITKFLFMKRSLACLTILLAILITACNKDHDEKDACGPAIKNDAALYDTIRSDNHTILDAVVDGDCLQITFSAAGCDGKSWKTSMVAATTVTDPLPLSKSLKLGLENDELCMAVITRTISFDLSLLKIWGTGEIALVLPGWNGELRYSYR